jgi:hypothetical protein
MTIKKILVSSLLAIFIMLAAMISPASAAQPGWYWRHRHRHYYHHYYVYHHRHRYWWRGRWYWR